MSSTYGWGKKRRGLGDNEEELTPKCRRTVPQDLREADSLGQAPRMT